MVPLTVIAIRICCCMLLALPPASYSPFAAEPAMLQWLPGLQPEQIDFPYRISCLTPDQLQAQWPRSRLAMFPPQWLFRLGVQL